MKKALYVLFLFILLPCTVPADGGGGMFFGRQQSGYPFLEEYPVPNNSRGLTYYGGYGYSVSYGNAITGGFGVAVVDHATDSGIGGGFGGLMNGVRIISRPLTIQIVNCAGLGGLSMGTVEGDGFFGFFDELTLEIGIPLTRWFMPIFFAGYQVVGQVMTENAFFDLFSYTPVIGIRIGWGDFF